MRAALSIVLATALVTTPLKLVLAQAAQQEAVGVQQTVPPDSSGQRLIGVPPVTDNTSRLFWRNPSDRTLLNMAFAAPSTSNTDLPYQENEETGWWKSKAAYVVTAIIAIVILFIVVYRYCKTQCDISQLGN